MEYKLIITKNCFLIYYGLNLVGEGKFQNILNTKQFAKIQNENLKIKIKFEIAEISYCLYVNYLKPDEIFLVIGENYGNKNI